jgi:hypothetical protein
MATAYHGVIESEEQNEHHHRKISPSERDYT